MNNTPLPIWGLHLAPQSDKTTFLKHLNAKKAHYTLCSQQQLLQPHLTIRENLHLLGAFYGLENIHNRLNILLTWGNIQEVADQKQLQDVPYDTMLLVNLLGALLPAPKLLIMDDWTGGLSLSAQKRLWQQLQQLPEPQPAQIIYLTAELTPFHFFTFDQIWVEQPHQLWKPAVQPPPSTPPQSKYLFMFDQAPYAQKFLSRLTEEGFSGEITAPPSVLVQCSPPAVADLMFFAGLHCLKVQHVEDIYSLQLAESAGISTEQLLNLWPIAPRPVLTTPQQLTAAWKLAWQEWQRHFRGFMQGANLLFLNLWTLSLASWLFSAVGQIPDDRNWWIIPFIWFSSAGGCLLWGIEAMNRLATKGDFKTSPTADRPFSKLSLIDSIGIHRLTTLLGLWGGQTLILLSHVLSLVAYITLLALPIFNWAELNKDHINFFMALIGLWWLIFLYLFPFTVLLGRLVHQKATAFLLGFITYWATFVALASVWRIPENWQSLTWPLTGFFFAYRHYFFQLPQPVTLPFGIALGTMVFWWGWAIYFFYHRPSFWQR